MRQLSAIFPTEVAYSCLTQVLLKFVFSTRVVVMGCSFDGLKPKTLRRGSLSFASTSLDFEVAHRRGATIHLACGETFVRVSGSGLGKGRLHSDGLSVCQADPTSRVRFLVRYTAGGEPTGRLEPGWQRDL